MIKISVIAYQLGYSLMLHMGNNDRIFKIKKGCMSKYVHRAQVDPFVGKLEIA